LTHPRPQPQKPILEIVTAPFGSRKSVQHDAAIDMRPFRDPAASGLGRHDGRRPKIIAQIRCNKASLEELMSQVDEVFKKVFERGGKTYTLMLYCRGGRHRSVAGAMVVEYIGRQCGFQCRVRHIDFVACECAVCSGDEFNRIEELRIIRDLFERGAL